MEFLPAALSLRDTPVHPAPRVASGLIILILLCGILWATLGKVDVVASAEGKIAPNEDVKVIQAQQTAVVIAIKVKDGEHVSQGQVLLDLDETDASTSAEHTRSDLQAARSEAARARAILVAVDDGQAPRWRQVDELDARANAEQRQVLAGEYSDYVSTRQELDFDVRQAEASLHQAEAEVTKLAQVLPIEQTKEDDYAKLIIPGYVGLHDYYNEQQAVIQLKQNLTEEKAKVIELRAARDSAAKKLDAYVAQTKRQWLEKASDDESKEVGLEQDLERSLQHKRLMHLVAPVNGVVQQMAVHTIGGVVTPAQVLMNVVPNNDELLAEVSIDNQDIGFVREGQDVEVKVETFPYTRYGTVQGRVVQLSNDAKQDDNHRWVFPARVSINASSLKIEGRSVGLVPGMEVTAEIKTNRRRIISYLMSPLVEHVTESMRER